MGITPPTPKLVIVPVESVFPHEEHDSQRAGPLIERLRQADLFTNPPIVAPLGDGERYVILDGANRCFSFRQLGYPHILVQEVDYHSDFVTLDTWHHVISDWELDRLAEQMSRIEGATLVEGVNNDPIASVTLRDNRVLSVVSSTGNWLQRNSVLRMAVRIYQHNAKLFRTVLGESSQVWSLYTKAIALVKFPRFQPEDILNAAKHGAYLPPGISRHIIHGRAVRLNYPMDWVRDPDTPVNVKNEMLQSWLAQKVQNRQMRFYAEATYQFDE